MTDETSPVTLPSSLDALAAVEREVAAACAQARRDRASVSLIAVSKTKPAGKKADKTKKADKKADKKGKK